MAPGDTNSVRVDASAKISGRAEYVDDLNPNRLLHGALVRSPHPHAEIVGIDVSGALDVEGVVAVVTGDELPHRYGVLPVTQDETALATDKVRYQGEPVAAVCAETRAAAERGRDAIEVVYDKLEPVLSIDDACNKDVRVHQSEHFEGNAHRTVALEFGDVEGAFSRCAEVFEDSYHYPGNTHLPMEPHATVANWDGERLEIDVSHQAPDNLHRVLPDVLDIPEHALRIRVPYIGGGFGGKLDPFPDTICAAKLAMKTGRPVKITLDREEVFFNHRGRHPVTMHIRTGWDDGKLEVAHIQNFLDGGAYSSYGVATSYYQGTHQPVTYDIPNYKVDVVRFYTNKPPCGPKRGHGLPQPRFAIESHLDRIARETDSDPVSLRTPNLTEPDSLAVNAVEITSNGLAECVDRVVQSSNFLERHGSLPDGEGIGFALSSYLSGAALPLSWNDMPHTEVEVTVDRNGVISVFSGHTEIGQGSDTVLAKIVADTLGVSPQDVHLVLRDSDRVPTDLGSYSSRVTMMMGNAAEEAAGALRDALAEATARSLGESPDELTFEEGTIGIADDPERRLSLKEAAVEARSHRGSLTFTGTYHPPPVEGSYRGAGVGPSPAHSFTACVVRVSVDEATGFVTPRKIWIAHDIGKCIDRTNVEGQVDGGVYMGLCEVLMETQDHDADGLLESSGFLDYKTLTCADMPPIDMELVETDDPAGPGGGAKEVGQGPLLPVIPAVANAVFDACGIRFDTFPISPARLRQAIRWETDRVGPDEIIEFSFPEPTRVTPY